MTSSSSPKCILFHGPVLLADPITEKPLLLNSPIPFMAWISCSFRGHFMSTMISASSPVAPSAAFQTSSLHSSRMLGLSPFLLSIVGILMSCKKRYILYGTIFENFTWPYKQLHLFNHELRRPRKFSFHPFKAANTKRPSSHFTQRIWV